jgi:hypothetical protein
MGNFKHHLAILHVDLIKDLDQNSSKVKIMNKLLISGAVVVAGFIGKLFMDEKESERKRIEDEKESERKRIEDEKESERKRIEDEKERERKRIEDEKERERKQEEIVAAWKAEIKLIEEERIRLFSEIITSSNNSIKGYRIIRHIRMVSITDESRKATAEWKFLLAVEEAGGNGVLNMQVRPHHGGYFSVQGDAVLTEPV